MGKYFTKLAATGGGILLTLAGLLCNSSRGEEFKPLNSHEKPSMNSVYKNHQFKQIKWLLNNNDYSYSFDRNNPKSLEEIAFTDKNPLEKELTEWEMPSLARLIPLKKTIEKHASYYEINPMWAAVFFSFESGLNPADLNKMSNDYGLGQIKLSSEKLAKQKGSNPKDTLYSPYLDKNKSIFDPETNIIMSMLLNRYNIERFNIKNSHQVYAIYVRGGGGLNSDGSLSNLSKDLANSMHDRYVYFEKVIPIFRLNQEELSKIKNKDTKALMEIYHKNLSMAETYKQELNYFLNDLEEKVRNNGLIGNAREVLIYDDCLVFAKTINTLTGENQKNNYKRLLNIGGKLSGVVEEKELRNRVERTTGLLKEVMN